MLKTSEHTIDLNDIGRGALNVIEQLERAGFSAYLVGGGVRDLLVGGHPKDFDVATNATPEQVKTLFKRGARIVGRRFRIVHVRTGREITEVTTFRAHHDDADSEHHAAKSEMGMLLRDNVYGDIRSDAIRRDFTMNALYFSPKDGGITDYTHGVDDIDAGLVRVIGDPTERYHEDPVRMLRAVRLAAKLEFTIEPGSAAPIAKLGHLLGNVAPARLFDECLKLLMSGHALATFQGLRQFELLVHLFPATQNCLSCTDQTHTNQSDTDTDTSQLSADKTDVEIFERLLHQAMINTDARIRNRQRVTPAFILAVLLWPPVSTRQQQLLQQGMKPAPALNQASQEIIMQQVSRVAIPRRFTLAMREIWDLQLRLPRRNGQQAFRLVGHPRFRAAYDFLLLREEAGEDLHNLGQWWTDFQSVSKEERISMVNQLQQGKRRPRRPRRKSSPKNVH